MNEPERPLMPPLRPIEFLPFSLSLMRSSTVPASEFSWVSTSWSVLRVSK
jgi:hypothetical protein